MVLVDAQRLPRTCSTAKLERVIAWRRGSLPSAREQGPFRLRGPSRGWSQGFCRCGAGRRACLVGVFHVERERGGHGGRSQRLGAVTRAWIGGRRFRLRAALPSFALPSFALRCSVFGSLVVYGLRPRPWPSAALCSAPSSSTGCAPVLGPPLLCVRLPRLQLHLQLRGPLRPPGLIPGCPSQTGQARRAGQRTVGAAVEEQGAEDKAAGDEGRDVELRRTKDGKYRRRAGRATVESPRRWTSPGSSTAPAESWGKSIEMCFGQEGDRMFHVEHQDSASSRGRESRTAPPVSVRADGARVMGSKTTFHVKHRG